MIIIIVDIFDFRITLNTLDNTTDNIDSRITRITTKVVMRTTISS